MGARQPEVLGDALSLLLSGMFSARIDSKAPEQFGSVYDAAKALIESPALGIGAKVETLTKHLEPAPPYISSVGASSIEPPCPRIGQLFAFAIASSSVFASIKL